MNKPVMRALLVLGAICIITTTFLIFSIGKWIYDDSRYYQQAERIMPVAYEFSYQLTEYTETHKKTLINRDEIIQLLASPELSGLAKFPFSIEIKPTFMVTFSINQRNIIRIARFHPEHGNSFSPQLAHTPRK